MDQLHNDIIAEHNLKNEAGRLLSDFQKFAVLSKLDNLIDRLNNTEVTDEFLEQYQQISNAENPRQELEEKRRAQLEDLSEARVQLKALNDSLRNYSNLVQHSTDEAEVTRETRLLNTIVNSARAAQTRLKRVIDGFAFPEDDTDLIEASWVAQIAENRLYQPVEGSLDLDTDEYRAAQQDNRVIVVQSDIRKEEPKVEIQPEEEPKKQNAFQEFYNNARKKITGLLGEAEREVKLAASGNGTTDLSKLSLFPHDPSPEDVRQGNIGNCYLHTVLNMVAKQAPDLIRECMKESPDGKSVTCRFFKPRELFSREPQKPIYVTVPKEQIVRKRREMGSQGTLWTIVLETAFANSGLGKAVSKEQLQADSKNAVLNSMAGGSITGFAEMLLGDKVTGSEIVRVKAPKKKTDKQDEVDGPKDADKQDEVDGPKDIDEQMKEMHDLLEKGGILGCAHPKARAAENEKTGNGIYYNHAYGVMGIDLAKKEITLRNPHNAEEEKGAEFTMSFEEFSTTFTEFTGSKVKDVYKTRDIQTVKDNYKRIVDKLDAALSAQDNIFLHLFKNSTQFNNLRRSVTELKTALNSKTASVTNITQQMDKAFQAAMAYKDITFNKEANATRQNRIALADAIVALHETMEVDVLTDPAESYSNRLKGVVAQKIATAFNQKLKLPQGQQMKKEDFLNTPSFSALFATTEQLENAAFSSSTTNLMNRIQNELQKSGQQIAPKQKDAPVKQAQVGVKEDGPRMSGPN